MPKLLCLQQGEHERIPEPLFVTVRAPFALYYQAAMNLVAGERPKDVVGCRRGQVWPQRRFFL